MGTTNLIDSDVMDRIINYKAWKNLSKEFSWNEQLLEKCKDKVDWKEVSRNEYVLWTSSLLEKFKDDLDWHELSLNSNKYLYTEALLEKYSSMWDWSTLSWNYDVHWNESKLNKFADRIFYALDEGNMKPPSFFNNYKKYIPIAKLINSELWPALIKERQKEIIEKFVLL